MQSLNKAYHNLPIYDPDFIFDDDSSITKAQEAQQEVEKTKNMLIKLQKKITKLSKHISKQSKDI